MRTPSRRRPTLIVATLSLLASFALLSAAPVFAQEVPGGEALVPWLLMIFLLIFIPFYIYWALATQIIAKKTNTENGWMAWIPIANAILWANIAKKPIWWGLLCIIPLVGLVFMVILWMAIAEARHKPYWWGIMLIVPLVNLIVPGYLAWSD
jgi:hypothetical protein